MEESVSLDAEFIQETVAMDDFNALYQYSLRKTDVRIKLT